MPYVAGEYLVNVRGHLSTTEIWDNSWCVIDPTGVQDVQEAIDILNVFYEDMGGFASVLSAAWGADSASATSLATGLTAGYSFSPVIGSSAAARLPNQLAVRISLRSGFANGGPFLVGFASGALGSGGQVDSATILNIQTAFETMTSSLTSAGWQLGLNQPTAGLATQVTSARVGNRWDVIRKRANDLIDTYTQLDVA